MPRSKQGSHERYQLTQVATDVFACLKASAVGGRLLRVRKATTGAGCSSGSGTNKSSIDTFKADASPCNLLGRGIDSPLSQFDTASLLTSQSAPSFAPVSPSSAMVDLIGVTLKHWVVNYRFAVKFGQVLSRIALVQLSLGEDNPSQFVCPNASKSCFQKIYLYMPLTNRSSSLQFTLWNNGGTTWQSETRTTCPFRAPSGR